MRHVVSDASDAIASLSADDWLVLTSVFAVNAVHAPGARVPRVAVVGRASREAADARGLRVGLVSSGGDAASLFAELRAQGNSGKVCYPRSSLAQPPDPWPGVEIISPILYETIQREFDKDMVARTDIVSVASPSAVEAVGVVERPYASIGPATTAALRRFGITPVVEAPERSFESLARAIADYAGSSRSQRA